MKYIEGEGFKLTEGDSWNRKLLVLQLVNHQGAWIDEITIEKNTEFKDKDIQNLIKEFSHMRYRVLIRESKETILKLKDI